MSANTATFISKDGYRTSLPLAWLLEKEALLAYQVNGEDLSASVGGSNQLWIPSAAAKYFARDVVEIVLSHEETLPPVPGEEEAKEIEYVNRPNAGITGSGGANTRHPVGEPVTFEGWADDYGRAITAIEFSMDDGETWTRHETHGTASGKWVYWRFAYTPESHGVYTLKVRSVNELGEVSPMAATVAFRAG